MVAMKFLFAVLVLMVIVHYSYGCTCLVEHPQTRFCRNSVVFKARILGNGTKAVGNYTLKGLTYPIKITQIYKGFDKFQNSSTFSLMEKINRKRRSVRVGSFFTSEICGIPTWKLKTGEAYVFGGRFSEGYLGVEMCDLILPLEEYDSVEKATIRNLLKRKYPKACGCTISPRARSKNSCIWHERDVCATKFKYCGLDKEKKNTCKMFSTESSRKCVEDWNSRMP